MSVAHFLQILGFPRMFWLNLWFCVLNRALGCSCCHRADLRKLPELISPSIAGRFM